MQLLKSTIVLYIIRNIYFDELSKILNKKKKTVTVTLNIKFSDNPIKSNF